MPHLGEVLHHLRTSLSAVTDEADLESQILLLRTFHLTRTQLLMDLQRPLLNTESLCLLYDRLEQRLGGMPLAYVLGEWEFCGKWVDVEPGVLIPRPETEQLVDMTTEFIQTHDVKTVLELGPGTGIIGLELALRCPDIDVLAMDVSPIAVRVSKSNQERFKVSNYQVLEGDFLLSDWGGIDTANTVLVSNPPYIPSKDIETLDPIVRKFEPSLALDGGEDGLFIYKQLFTHPILKMLPMILEIGYDLQPGLESLAEYTGRQASFSQDLSGHPRVVISVPEAV